MKVVKQKASIKIKNYDLINKTTALTSSNNNNNNNQRHGTLLPSSIRCIICGPSGGGNKQNKTHNLHISETNSLYR